jgi:hypothetical protein
VANLLHPLGQLGQYATVGFAVAFGLWLALRQKHWSAPVLFWQIALVQVLFGFALVVHASAVAGTLAAYPLVSGYGVPPTILTLLVIAAAAARANRASESSSIANSSAWNLAAESHS